MRYGAVNIARLTGGLKDTVVDYKRGGLGISFDYDSEDDLVHAISRGLTLYKNKRRFNKLRLRASQMDYSWSKSAKLYTDIYERLI